MMHRKSVVLSVTDETPERDPESKVESEPISKPEMEPVPMAPVTPAPESKAQYPPEPVPESKVETQAVSPQETTPTTSIANMPSSSTMKSDIDFPALSRNGRSRPVSRANSPLPAPRTHGVKVITAVRPKSTYKSNGKGFAVWKKHRGQTLYTATELYCTKTFGGDAGKLKRYLVNKGGFKKDQIKSVQTFQVEDRNTHKKVHHARIYVDGKMEDIKNGMAQLESSRGEGKSNVIWISRPKRNERGNKLMVKNFDILTEKDHRAFTRMFQRFGVLQSEIQMGRNNNGVNYALVTYRDMEDARKCERAQNDTRWTQQHGLSALEFNGRTLQIGYAADREMRNRNGKW